MKVVYLDYQVRSVTGGHKYNDAFLQYLTEYADVKIVKTPSCAVLYSGWRKILSPFLELKRLKHFCNGCVVFWGDTSYKHHFLLALLTKILRRTKSVIIVHHFSFLGEKGIKRRIMFVLQYLYISLCGDIIVPSPYTLAVAKSLFPRKKIHYIPLPFNRNLDFSVDYEVGNFLYVGTIDKRKGLMYLIEALGYVRKEKKDFEFVLNVVGKITDHLYYDEIINRIKQLGMENNVFFRGRVDDVELDFYQRKAEIFTFPSLLEGYGIVLIEAMRKGIPVIAFDNSAMPYTIVDGENGFMAENKNIRSFAEKIMLLSGNIELRNKMQMGMKKTMESLKTRDDFEKGIRDFFNYYESMP